MMTERWRNCYKELGPFCALVAVQFTDVGVNILFKEATFKGLSYYVFIFYSFILSTLILLLPLPFIFRRSTGLPSLNLSILCKIFSLGVLASSAQVCGYKGIDLSSPTLASAMANLLPAFTFILAIFFRMEKADLRSSRTQVKIMGSIASIAGALIIVLYKGRTILNAASPSEAFPLNSPLVYSQGNWVLDPYYQIVSSRTDCGLNLCGTIVAAPVCFLGEKNLSNWRLKPDITLVAISYSAVFSTFFSTVVYIWSIHLKGPVYVSIFNPLSIAIASAMSVVFLGETLYLGSVVGAVILCIGFYAVIWGKAKEEELHPDENYCLSNPVSQLNNSKAPLLHG